MITIRNYITSDAQALRSIHFNTIHNINTRDYSKEQVDAWAPASIDKEFWQKRFKDLSPFVAQINETIVGYTDLQNDGLIDHFFCHHEYQGKGIGRKLMTHVLVLAKERGIKRLYSEVSITARPFYEHFGIHLEKEQEFEIRGQKLKNFVMERFI